jgi:transcriptional regulator with XRE-family HTH domain
MPVIKQARLLAGFTHRQAAAAIGVDKDTIVKYERPGRTNFSTDILTRMADEYGKRIPGGLTVDQLLGRAPLTEAADVGA